jgi:hypothetical protein
MLGVEEDWHYVGTVGEPSFQSTWANLGDPYQRASFYKDTEGKVHLRGFIQPTPPGGQPSGNIVFQLPIGYRPQYILDPQVIQHARINGTAAAHYLWMGTFEIGTDGVCSIANGWDYDWVSISDIIFWTPD